MLSPAFSPSSLIVYVPAMEHRKEFAARFRGASVDARSKMADKTSKAMHEYIDNELYKQFQEAHAGRVSARQYIIQRLKAAFHDNPFRLLEMGPGPDALSTVDFAQKLPQANLTTVDLDKTIMASVRARLAQKGLKQVDLVQGNIVDYTPSVPYDAFVACGAFTDLPPKERGRFLSALPRKLKQGGVFMVEEEVFPALFNSTSADTQAKAKWRHHGNVIFDAALKNCPELIKLELQALHSSLHGVGDFKNSVHGMVSEFKQAGLKDIAWRKIWPTEKDIIPLQNVQALDLSQPPPETWGGSERAWDALSTNVMRELLQAKTSQLSDPHFKSAYTHALTWLKRVISANALYQPDEAPETCRRRLSQALGIPLQFGEPVSAGNKTTFPKIDPDGGVFVYSARVPASE